MEATHRRPGFTLIEVMVALTLAALLATVSWTLVVALGDGADRLAALGNSAEREANVTSLIRDLVRRAELDPSRSLLLHGTPDSVTFVSWCDSPWGWQERCGVALAAIRGADSGTMRVRTNKDVDFVLPGPPTSGALLYLDQNFGPREYKTYWDSPMLLPAAIAVPRQRDTLLLVIAR